MNERRNHPLDDLDEQLELYALGALDDDERAEVERRLNENPAARERVRELRGTLGMLALDLEPMEPPSDLRGRILQAVRADDAAVDDEPASRTSPRDPATPEPVSLSSVRTERESRSIWLPWAIAAVLAVALAASLFWNVAQDDDPDIVTHTVAGADPSVAVAGELVVLRDEQGAVLSLAGLQPLEADQVFQVWLIDEGAPHPSVTFVPNADGLASVVIPANVEEFEVLAITVEPEGGSPQPTTEPIIVSDLTS